MYENYTREGLVTELVQFKQELADLKAEHQELKEMYEWLHQQHQELLGLVGEYMYLNDADEEYDCWTDEYRKCWKKLRQVVGE